MVIYHCEEKKYSKSKKNGSESQRKKLVIKLGDRLCSQRKISEMCQNKKANNQDSARDMEWKFPQVSNFPQKQQNRICKEQTEHNK